MVGNPLWKASIRIAFVAVLFLAAASPSAAEMGEVRIVSPQYDSDHVVGDKIYFTSSLKNKAGGEITNASFVWISNLDGTIGTGASVIVSTLSVGLHRITLDVTGKSEIIGSDTVKIKVGLAKSSRENDNPAEIGIGTGGGAYVPNPFN